MEREKPDTDDPSVTTIGALHTDKKSNAMTVTELMDRIERTALERYFAARASLWQSYESEQAPSAG